MFSRTSCWPSINYRKVLCTSKPPFLRRTDTCSVLYIVRIRRTSNKRLKNKCKIEWLKRFCLGNLHASRITYEQCRVPSMLSKSIRGSSNFFDRASTGTRWVCKIKSPKICQAKTWLFPIFNEHQTIQFFSIGFEKILKLALPKMLCSFQEFRIIWTALQTRCEYLYYNSCGPDKFIQISSNYCQWLLLATKGKVVILSVLIIRCVYWYPLFSGRCVTGFAFTRNCKRP